MQESFLKRLALIIRVDKYMLPRIMYFAHLYLRLMQWIIYNYLHIEVVATSSMAGLQPMVTNIQKGRAVLQPDKNVFLRKHALIAPQFLN